MALAISCLTEMLDCLPNNLFVITSTLGEIITTEVRPLGESVLIQTLFSALYTKFMEIAENDIANRTGESTALSKSSICTTLAEAICSIDEDNKHTEGIQNLVAKGQTYVNSIETNDHAHDIEAAITKSSAPASSCATNLNGHPEFVVDSSDSVPDILCGDLLKTSVGKQCAKVIFTITRNKKCQIM